MNAVLCGEAYARPSGEIVRCTYIEHHPVRQHSWFAVRSQDEADAATRTQVADYTPVAIQAVLNAIVRGDLDLYVEAILEAGHNRKRARRGVVGFPLPPPVITPPLRPGL